MCGNTEMGDGNLSLFKIRARTVYMTVISLLAPCALAQAMDCSKSWVAVDVDLLGTLAFVRSVVAKRHKLHASGERGVKPLSS